MGQNRNWSHHEWNGVVVKSQRTVLATIALPREAATMHTILQLFLLVLNNVILVLIFSLI